MKTIKVLKILLQYFVGVILMLSSIMILVTDQRYIVGSIMVFLGSLICLPMSRWYVERKLNFKLSKSLKYTIVIFCWIFSCVPRGENENSKHKEQQNFVQLSGDETKTTKKNIKNENPVLKQVYQSNSNITNAGNLPKQKIISEENSKSAPKKNSRKNKNIQKNKIKKTSVRIYVRGPRGGCYYINSNGNKTYVDGSFCN